MTSPTPGPWKYVPSTKGGGMMAQVWCGEDTRFQVYYHPADGKADANARLAAAAPEMLQALKCVQNWIDRDCPELYAVAGDDTPPITIEHIIHEAMEEAEGES